MIMWFVEWYSTAICEEVCVGPFPDRDAACDWIESHDEPRVAFAYPVQMISAAEWESWHTVV